MPEPHVIAALVRKRAELSGELLQTELHARAIRADLEHIDRVLAIFGFGARPDTIPPSYKRPPRMFKDGQLRRLISDIRRENPEIILERAIVREAVRRMGWDANNQALLKFVTASEWCPR
jgi:hypothetical protein